MKLQGKTALVTGGGRGIGAAIAMRFGKEGAKVVVNDVNAETGGNLSDRINAEGGSAVFIQGDISKETDVEKMVNLAVETYGGLDILVNNAGIEAVGFVHEMTGEEWSRVMDINMKGLFLGSKHAVRRMLAEGNGGSIVNISSVAGLRGFPGLGAYCAAKHGVIGLTRTMALELRSRNIRVNAICPGFVQTEMFTQSSETYSKTLDVNIEEIVSTRQHRMGTVQEIASAAVFLASDESSLVSGTAMPLDYAMSAG